MCTLITTNCHHNATGERRTKGGYSTEGELQEGQLSTYTTNKFST